MSERPPFNLVEAAILAVESFPDDIEGNHSEIVSIIVNALLAEREAERARCDAILKEAFGANVTVGALTASVADRWLPIETAPKDGTSILAWVRFGGVVTIWWGAAAYNRKTKSYDSGWTSGANYGYEPTHWMPLPAPPSPAKQAEEQTR